MDEEVLKTEDRREVSADKSYNKRPWWQWVIIYLVVGTVLYILIYYFFFAGRSTVTGY